MKRVITIFALILSVIAGSVGCKQSGSQSNELITVDVTAKYPKKELILQDFMDVEYIPLETTDEFITMAHIEAIGKDVIIFRNRNRSTDGKIFIYDRNGKAMSIINRLGQGGEEYLFLLDITLDEDNNEIFVNDHYSKKIFVYDLEGNFRRSFLHKDGTMYDVIYNFDRDNLICHDSNRGYENAPRNIFFIISKQNGSIIKEIQIPFEEEKSTVLTLINESGMIGASARNEELIPYRDSWILVETSSDTVYRYSLDHTMTPFIVRVPSIQAMEPEVFLFPGVFTDRYYFMQAVKKEYDFETDKGFPKTDLMYDRQEKTIFEYIVYNDDYSNKETINLGHGIFFVNNEIAFLQKIEAYELVEAYEKGQLKGQLKEIAATLDEESNPVIMLIKHKK